MPSKLELLSRVPLFAELDIEDLHRVAARTRTDSFAAGELVFEIGEPGHSLFIIAEGESVHGPIPPTGNTNTRAFFEPDVRTFLKRSVAEGPTHHFALGVGHHAGTIAKIAEILELENVVVK